MSVSSNDGYDDRQRFDDLCDQFTEAEVRDLIRLFERFATDRGRTYRPPGLAPASFSDAASKVYKRIGQLLSRADADYVKALCDALEKRFSRGEMVKPKPKPKKPAKYRSFIIRRGRQYDGLGQAGDVMVCKLRFESMHEMPKQTRLDDSMSSGVTSASVMNLKFWKVICFFHRNANCAACLHSRPATGSSDAGVTTTNES